MSIQEKETQKQGLQDKGSLENILETMKQNLSWVSGEIKDIESIPTGDMPGDKVQIGPEHIRKSRIILPLLVEQLIPVLEENQYGRAVVVVCGGSGVGKSETASLLSYYLNEMGLGTYTLSGDNYPHRLPKYNDAERSRIFRKSGIEGMIANGQYNEKRKTVLKELQESGNDSNATYVSSYPWLAVYQQAGRNGLKNYLGTNNEIDFKELTGIISQFKNGVSEIFLKRMGREETELWYDPVDFKEKNILVIEWTHGNNDNLQGVDIPILLNSTPQETLEHRKARNRDGGTDSPFITTVLELEQQLLVAQASKAKLILTKAGELIDYDEFLKLMTKENK
ncbi:adenylyl-sulfate kinase [Mangrovibacterium marinum]|uniref:APS kinase domain-containing protein n=1 Tax=Mangrovibacterium marinum TaxID=1639118 RepID=A0A2T5C4S0_9BACT|nr:adenylyl-sulfate kinase [Mangrovibacterium marinum]PTN09868.1 hypothetical protein C8N47_103165 [Mangrovibacterium marinum]